MRSKKTLLLAGLSCILLAACHANDNTNLARSNSGETYAAPAGTTPQSSTASRTATDTGNAMSSSTSSDMRNDMSPSSMNISSATVQSIETVPRSMDQGSADMQSGTSGTAGSTSGAAGNMLYRVTLRLDDGTTRTFMQNSQPAFQIGDRVSVQKGVMQRY
ncbi:hypothetical protein [Janthinobacterium violaceinigrum]|uniref:Lipoprotein n=1 Tax=Janthinobacterium violaceinigrum TaxID=2654252 RepID=A0A6I1HY29_9BURK|nr:hypothetical protein [Janthinobacterium violaceinigrum]KAB8063614.1 hypothetical protein GCN75_17275 [Janthinobacterium violaceinigrum]